MINTDNPEALAVAIGLAVGCVLTPDKGLLAHAVFANTSLTGHTFSRTGVRARRCAPTCATTSSTPPPSTCRRRSRTLISSFITACCPGRRSRSRGGSERSQRLVCCQLLLPRTRLTDARISFLQVTAHLPDALGQLFVGAFRCASRTISLLSLLTRAFRRAVLSRRLQGTCAGRRRRRDGGDGRPPRDGAVDGGGHARASARQAAPLPHQRRASEKLRRVCFVRFRLGGSSLTYHQHQWASRTSGRIIRRWRSRRRTARAEGAILRAHSPRAASTTPARWCASTRPSTAAGGSWRRKW